MYPMTTHNKRLTAGASSAFLLVALVAGCSSTPSDESSPSADSSTSASSTPSAESAPSDDAASDDIATNEPSAVVVAFCSDAQTLIEGEAIEGVDPSDTDAVNTVVSDMIAHIDATEAPDEIADDWALFSDGMKQFLTAAQSLTAADEASGPAAEEQMTAASALMSSPEMGVAEDNVSTFISANCEA